MESGKVLHMVEGPTKFEDGHGMIFDGLREVSASLKVWDAEGGDLVRMLQRYASWVTRVAMPPDDFRVVFASYGEGEALREWDVKSGKVVHTFEGREHFFYSVAVMTNGRWACSAASDKTLRMWDLTTGRNVATLEAHAPFECCAVTSSGRIFAGDHLGALHILDWLTPTAPTHAPPPVLRPSPPPRALTTLPPAPPRPGTIPSVSHPDPRLQDLRAAYDAGNLVVFAGAGLSAAAGLPTWPKLAADLLARLRQEGKPADAIAEVEHLLQRGQLVDALSAVKDALGRPEFELAIEKACDDRGLPVPDAARAVAALEPKLRAVITTNLDRLLERAFEGAWDALPRATGDIAARRRYILKIHGTLLDRSTWVISRDQYDRYLFDSPAMRGAIEALFRTCPILFVGFTEDDLDETFRSVRAFSGQQPPVHFALVPAGGSGYRRKKLEEAGLRIVEYAGADGKHGEAAEIMRALAAPNDPTSPVPGASTPASPRVPPTSAADAVAAVRAILGACDLTGVAFDGQNERARALMDTMTARLGVREHYEFEEFFYLHAAQMIPRERFVFGQIRATTDGMLREQNSEILRHLAEHPELLDRIPRLRDLRKHLERWDYKYRDTFTKTPEMCVLYVGVEDKVPWPHGIEETLRRWLAEQGTGGGAPAAGAAAPQEPSRDPPPPKLGEVLASLYGNKADIQRLCDEVGIARARVDFDGSVRNVWHRVLVEAGNSGHKQALLDAVGREYPARRGDLGRG